MLTKKLTFTDDVLDVLKAMSWSDDGKIGKLNGNLDRRLYTKVNTALEAMGGKWNKKEKGHVFSEDPRPQVTGLLATGSLIIARDGFFRTPRDVVKLMIDAVGIPEDATILEPSAGDGSIADVLVEHGAKNGNIFCVEKNEQRVKILKEKGYVVTCNDFLQMPIEYYDRIFMNPPFEEGQDIDHVQFAYCNLDEGGKMVAIMSESPFFRSDRRSTCFREWLDEVGGKTKKLPSGAFKESGTMVNTRIIVIEKEKKVEVPRQIKK